MRPLFALLLAACGTRHLVLMPPMTSPGLHFVCDPVAKEGNCRLDPDWDPSKEALSGSVYVNLPAECRGLVNKIVVQRLRSGHPTVFVTCAPPE